VQRSSDQDDRIGPDSAHEDDMKHREQLVTRSHENVHSDLYDQEVFAWPPGQHHHLRAGFICGTMDSRPGSTRLTPVHTRCCHEFEATSARLRRCRQASSLDRHRSLTMHETCSICLTKYGAMAKLTTTASVGSYTTVNVHRHGNTLHQRHSLGRSGVRTSCTRPLSRAFLTSPSRVGAGRTAELCLPTPLSEPGMRLSPHPALQGVATSRQSVIGFLSSKQPG
jgi:hypothetical protein